MNTLQWLDSRFVGFQESRVPHTHAYPAIGPLRLAAALKPGNILSARGKRHIGVARGAICRLMRRSTMATASRERWNAGHE